MTEEQNREQLFAFDAKAIARFWSKVDKRRPDECWPWKGALSAGYGHMSFARKNMRAHRLSLLINGSTLPEGMVVDHICRNRACVNPAHLRCVSPRINCIENSDSAVAINARNTHCPRGHPLVEGNLRPYALLTSRRECLTCKRESDRIAIKRRRDEEKRHVC